MLSPERPSVPDASREGKHWVQACMRLRTVLGLHGQPGVTDQLVKGKGEWARLSWSPCHLTLPCPEGCDPCAFQSRFSLDSFVLKHQPLAHHMTTFKSTSPGPAPHQPHTHISNHLDFVSASFLSCLEFNSCPLPLISPGSQFQMSPSTPGGNLSQFKLPPHTDTVTPPQTQHMELFAFFCKPTAPLLSTFA